jgi:chromosome segregation ATPase
MHLAKGVGGFMVGTWRTLSGAELAAAKRDLQAAQARQRAAENERQILKDQAAVLSNELELMTADLDECEQRIAKAEARVRELRQQLEETSTTTTTTTTTSSNDEDGPVDEDGVRQPTQAELTREIDETMARIRLEQDQVLLLHQQIQTTMRQLRYEEQR